MAYFRAIVLSVICIIVFIVVLTPEQAMQAAITKNVKLITTPNTLPVKQLLPMPPGIQPSISNVPPKPQNAQKTFLPPPPTPPRLLLSLSPLKRPPPLPSTIQISPTMPPPPPPPTLPPPLPTPNKMLIPPGVTQLPPPIPPADFPMYPYPPLQNAGQSFRDSIFSQPPNLTSSVPKNMTQQSTKSFSDFETQDKYEGRRLKYIKSHAFSRDSAFYGRSYGNGSQYFVDGGPHFSRESGQHYVDSGIQFFHSDPAYLQFRGNLPYKRGFNTRTNRPSPPPPQYQNRQVRHHPY